MIRPIPIAAAALVAAAGVASPAQAHAARQKLEIRGATGQLELRGIGKVQGSMRSGELRVGASTDSAFEVRNVSYCMPVQDDLVCSGAALTFRLRPGGSLDLRIQGAGISLTVVGIGSVGVSSSGGTYTVGSGRRRPLPRGITLRF